MSTIDLPIIRQRIDVDSSALGGLKGKMGSLAGTLGKGVAAGAGIAAAGVAAFVGKGVAGAIDVERGVREVVTLFGETGAAADEMAARLSSGVADLSQEVGLAQDAITGGLYQAISAGIPEDNAFDFMKVASQAAIAGVTDIETSVDGLTTIINAFGLDADEAGAVADSMFAAVQGGKTTFEELSASMFNVAPAAAGLGVGFEDVNAAIATLTSSGTPTSVATTQMRQALSELSKEGSVAGDAFEEIAGQSFPEFIAAGGTLEEGLAMMGDAAGDNATELANMFGSVEAGQAAAQLGVTNAEKFRTELERQEGAAGAAGDAYETMDQTTGRALERLRTTFDNVAQSVGSQLLPAIADAAEWIAERLPGAIEAVRPFVEQLVSRFVTFAQTVGPILATVGEAIGQFMSIIVDRDFTGGPFSEDSPIIFGLFAIRDAFTTVRDIVSAIIETIVIRFTSGGDRMGETGSRIGEVFSQVGEVVQRIGEIIGVVAGWIAEVWQRHGQQLMDNVQTVFDAILAIISGVLDVILGVVDVVLGVLTGDWSRAWEGIKRIVSGVWEVIKGVISAAITLVKNMIQSGLAIVATIFGDAWASIVRGMENAGDSINTAVRDMVSAVIRKGGEALDWFRELPGRILSAIGNVHTLLASAGRNIVQGLIDGLGEKIQAVRDKVSEITGAIGRFFPFSPAREGPLSGRGSPDRAGRTIATMLASGIDDERDAVSRAARGLAATVDRSLPSSLGLSAATSELARSAVRDEQRATRDASYGRRADPTLIRDLHVHNPSRETAEESINRQLRKLTHLGAR